MGSNYITPDFKKDSFTCPHCGTLSLMHYHSISFQGCTIVSSKSGVNKYGDSTMHIAICQNCKNKTIWIDNAYLYPDIVAEEANPDMPESVKQLYEEAGAIYNKSPRAACALLRLAIDRLCNELGEKDKDINKNISALVKKGLPQQLQQALDIVRVVGNKAVHPGQIAFDVDDKETAITLMKLVNIITQQMITVPGEIKTMFGKLPESVKTSIEKRDK